MPGAAPSAPNVPEQASDEPENEIDAEMRARLEQLGYLQEDPAEKAE